MRAEIFRQKIDFQVSHVWFTLLRLTGESESINNNPIL